MKHLNHINFLYKPKFDYMEKFINNIQNIKILEFGVMKGRSTSFFLDQCKKLDGKLVSVDINDHSRLFEDKRWTFIHSRDDNFETIEKIIKNNSFDIIYIDTLHEPNHVKKIFYNYYKFLKIGGRVFIDDINWLPYVKDSFKDSEYSEVINRKTFTKIIEIYYQNLENLKLEISFGGTGTINFEKLNNLTLNEPIKIKNRIFGLRNLARFFFRRSPKM